jgi:anti-anti-sigma regulatory factor
LVKIFRKVQEKDGKMKMVYPEVKNAEVFTVTGLPKIINFYNTLEEALGSFN